MAGWSCRALLRRHSMNQLAVALGSLPHVREVVPLSDADKPLVDEVTAVLQKHGALGRFGLTLLHRHFEIGDDEILVETTDAASRTQTVRPVSKEGVANEQYLVTSWHLGLRGPVMACVCMISEGGHTGEHRHVPGR